MSLFRKGKDMSHIVSTKRLIWEPRSAPALLAAPRTQPPLSVAQRINYDVLSYIFILSLPEWEKAALTLRSVCRLWQTTALSMPQLWSTIYFGAFNDPKYISMFLSRSQSLPLHVRLRSVINNKHFEVLKSVRDRVVSTKIDENQQPIKRLGGHDMWRPLPRPPVYRLLKAMNVVRDPEMKVRMSCTPTYRLGFLALRSLDVSCNVAHWAQLIRNVEKTIVSLHIRIMDRPEDCRFPLMFQQLRHLRITKYDDSVDPVLNIAAPHLESLDERYDFGLRTAKQIRLWGLSNVTYLHTGKFPLELSSYPALRVLWLRDMAQYARESIIPSLQTQILCTPELKEIGYYDHTHHIQPKEGLPDRLPSPFFLEICNSIQVTGSDIVVKEFTPSDLNLPGSRGY